jgi:hypothetical protein
MEAASLSPIVNSSPELFGELDAQNIARFIADWAHANRLNDRITLSRVERELLKDKVIIALDFSHHPLLNSLIDTNTANENARTLLFQAFELEKALRANGFPRAHLVLEELDLSCTRVSGKSLLDTVTIFVRDEAGLKKVFLNVVPEDLLKTIRKVNFSSTAISTVGLYEMRRLARISHLFADYCPNVNEIALNLVAAEPCNTELKELSLVGITLTYRPDLFKRLASRFPNVSVIYMTQPIESPKLLGIKDAVTLGSIVKPVALDPCGHIVGIENLSTRVERLNCDTCRQIVKKILPVKLPITRFSLEGMHWKVAVLDYQRKPLSDRVFFHPDCSHFYNAQSLIELFKLNFEQQANDRTLIEACQGKHCPGCTKPVLLLNLMRVYPIVTPDDKWEESMKRPNLAAVQEYVNADLPPLKAARGEEAGHS